MSQDNRRRVILGLKRHRDATILVLLDSEFEGVSALAERRPGHDDLHFVRSLATSNPENQKFLRRIRSQYASVEDRRGTWVALDLECEFRVVDRSYVTQRDRLLQQLQSQWRAEDRRLMEAERKLRLGPTDPEGSSPPTPLTPSRPQALN